MCGPGGVASRLESCGCGLSEQPSCGVVCEAPEKTTEVLFTVVAVGRFRVEFVAEVARKCDRMRKSATYR